MLNRAAMNELSEHIQYDNTDKKNSAIGDLTPSHFEAASHRREHSRGT